MPSPYGILTNPLLTDDEQQASAQPLPTIGAAPPAQGQIPTIRAAVQTARPALAAFQPNPMRQRQEQQLESVLTTPRMKPTGFWPKAASILGDVGNAAGTVILGNDKMAGIPGTSQFKANQRNAEGRELQQLEREDTADQTAFGQNKLRGAQTDEAEARADALENPQGKEPKYTLQQTDEGLMRINDATGEATPVTYNGQTLKPKQTPVKPAGMHAVSLEVPGKGRVAGKTDDQGNLLLENGEAAPAGSTLYQQPNYGQMVLPTKTATFIGPDGVPREYQWNGQTQTYDKPLGVSASNAYGHEVAQAGAVQRGGDQLISDLQANRDRLGNLSAWVQKYGLNTPIADPELAGIQAELKTFAALQPAMHGFRSRSAQEAFENIIGDLQKNPDATIASIRGILKTAGAINPDSEQHKGGGTGATQSFTDGGITYHIPKDQIEEFKKDHPNAR